MNLFQLNDHYDEAYSWIKSIRKIYIYLIPRLSGESYLIELKIGSKGELFLPKALREQLNLQPGDKIFLDIRHDTISIKKIPSVEELLEMPYISKKMTINEIEKGLKDEQKKQMQMSLEDLNG